jgi:hypothetical protein
MGGSITVSSQGHYSQVYTNINGCTGESKSERIYTEFLEYCRKAHQDELARVRVATPQVIDSWCKFLAETFDEYAILPENMANAEKLG